MNGFSPCRGLRMKRFFDVAKLLISYGLKIELYFSKVILLPLQSILARRIFT